MFFFNKILRLTKSFFYSKKNWTRPNKKEILVYDEASLKFLNKYLDKKKYDTLYLRNTKRRELNMYTIIYMILNLNFSSEKYQEFYIKFVNPKFIITMIDNNINFYKLKNYFPNTIFIAIQNSHRMAVSDFFSRIKKIKNSNLNLKCDYILTYNDNVKRKYKEIINANFITVGSFKSNSYKKSVLRNKYQIVYISDFRAKNKIEKQYISWNRWFGDVENLLINLSKFLKLNNLKITILGGTTDQQLIEEKEYYKKIFKNNFKFIPRDQKRDNFKISDNSKIVININSTLGYEALSRGTKTAFFSVRSKDNKFISTRFNWPASIPKKGKFWTNSSSPREINRILNFLKNTTHLKWKKIIDKDHSNKLIFDYNNTIFKNLAKNINLPIKNL